MHKTNLPNQGEAEYLRPGEALQLVPFYSLKTLSRMADKGVISFVKLPSGHRRYSRADVLALAESGDAE